jgi:hypothetical protein
MEGGVGAARKVGEKLAEGRATPPPGRCRLYNRQVAIKARRTQKKNVSRPGWRQHSGGNVPDNVCGKSNIQLP